MKLSKIFCLSALGLICFSSCSNNEEEDILDNANITMTIGASAEKEADTRLVMQYLGGSNKIFETIWESGDKINVFASGASEGALRGTFTINSPKSGEYTTKETFTGTISQFGNHYYALYPAQDTQGFQSVYKGDDVITATIPSSQIARVGSFDKNAAVMVSKFTPNDIDNVSLNHVCSFLKVTVESEDILGFKFEAHPDLVTVKPNHYYGWVVAGKVDIKAQSGSGQVQTYNALDVNPYQMDQSDFVELFNSDRTKPLVQGDYYVAVIPGEYPGLKLTVTYKSSDIKGSTKTFESKTKKELQRRLYYNLGTY